MRRIANIFLRYCPDKFDKSQPFFSDNKSDMAGDTMEIFLTASGLVLGVSAFLYAVSFLDSGKRKIAKMQADAKIRPVPAQPKPASSIAQNRKPLSNNLARTLSEDLKNAMPERTCPICGTILTRDEPLYATHTTINKQQKVFIHGCPYCYKGSKK